MDMTLKIEAATYITLTSDFWTNSTNRGVYACTMVLDDRSTHLLDVVDASSASHNATYIMGECR